MVMATYTKGYQAHTTDGAIATLPDEVYENQKTYAVMDPKDYYSAEEIEVRDRQGNTRRALLRGDLYGLGTPGTGDPIVELID
jgi:hypothetical protein